MKIRTNLTAGATYAECDQQRDWWKQQAELMEKYSYNVKGTPPAGLWLPGTSVPPSSTGGGYVGTTWYPDKSGICGGTVPSQPPTPTPQPPTGGYVGGVWYPDKSGIC